MDQVKKTKLYIGNLSYDTTQDQLRELFGQAGTITDIVVISDRATGRSKGFGFVEYASEADAEKAVKMFNGHNFMNRDLAVNVARPKEERPRQGFGGGNMW
ncbi:MAG: RNA-binding protein [Candidatus Chisholmbacteria bacterium]|nr:RNA-binding protein [Candidatus Chisholmbacteria bacterium]